jgi:CO/xanthine dehydrogenase FAD-binding subunit
MRYNLGKAFWRKTAMLQHLHTLYRPLSAHEARARLQERQTYPIYGGGAYLMRLPLAARRALLAIVDLAELAPRNWQLNEDHLEIGSAATLATVSTIHPDVAAVIAAEVPRTLQNTLTVGDVLMECRPDSLILALLHGIAARVITVEHDQNTAIDMPRWCALSLEERRQLAVLGVIVQGYAAQWRFAAFKVARTPADAPIVGAVGFAAHIDPDPGAYSVLVGVLPQPVRYHEGITSTLSNYKGSAAYRTAMASVVHEEAIRRARQLVQGG